MNRIFRILCPLVLGAAVVGCSDQGPVAQDSSVVASQGDHRAGDVVLALNADDQKVLTTVGKRIPGQGLIGNGAGGYLAFGPYAALDSGAYMLTVYGTLTVPAPQNAVVVDVVHAQGSVQDAKVIFDRGAEPDGNRPVLIRLKFDMRQAAQDVEFRVLLQPGARATMTGYKVTVGG